MKLTKLTVLTIFFTLTIAAFFTSCKKDPLLTVVTEFQKTGIAMKGANETPANASAASGTMDVYYSKITKMLSYTVNWTGLTDSLSLMHIHGLAPAGFAAGVVQNIVATSNSIFPQKTSGKFTFAKSGTLSGTLLIDGSLVKEIDLLNGMYYMNIHTATYGSGEIRGQITFQ